MDKSTIIRGKVIEILNGLQFNGAAIPVFDEIVNPNTPLPSISGAQEVYIVLQDQQQTFNSVQTVCSPRFNLNLTIRVVTKWGTTGSKKLCEDISYSIYNLLTDDRKKSKVDGVRKIELSISKTLTETTNSNLSFTKIQTFNFIYNA